MQITKDTVVTLQYKVTDDKGAVLDAGKEPQAYMHGGYGNILPAIEAALEGKEAGFATTLGLHPQEAFGPRDESLVRTIPKKDFPPGVKVGGQLSGYTDQGHEQTFTVMKIKGDQVLLDGNHPFAGKALRFSLKVLKVRAALPVEVEHGHAHGEGGHHHQ